MALGRLLRPVIYVALVALPIAFCIWVAWSLAWMAEIISPSIAGLDGDDAPRGIVLARALNEQRVAGSARDASLFGDFKNDFWALIVAYCFWIVVNLIMSGLALWMCFLEYKRNRLDNSTWFRNTMFLLVTIVLLTEIFVRVALPERLVRMNAITFFWLLIKDGLLIGFAFGWDFTIPSAPQKSKQAVSSSRSNSTDPESIQVGSINRQGTLLKSPQLNGPQAPGSTGNRQSMRRNPSRARSARLAKGTSSASFASSSMGTSLTGNTLVLGPMHLDSNGAVSPNTAPNQAQLPPLPKSPMSPMTPESPMFDRALLAGHPHASTDSSLYRSPAATAAAGATLDTVDELEMELPPLPPSPSSSLSGQTAAHNQADGPSRPL